MRIFICLLLFVYSNFSMADISVREGGFSWQSIDYQNSAEPDLAVKRNYSSKRVGDKWSVSFAGEELVIVQPFIQGVAYYGPYGSSDSSGKWFTYNKSQSYSWPGYAVVYSADGIVYKLKKGGKNSLWSVVGDDGVKIQCIDERFVTVFGAVVSGSLPESYQNQFSCGEYKIKWSDGQAKSFSPRGGKFKLVSYVNSVGQSFSLDYDAAGRLLSVNSPGGRRLSFGYDQDSRVVSFSGPGGSSANYEYDQRGNLIKVVRAGGDVEAYGYSDAADSSLLTEVFNRAGQLVQKIRYGQSGRAEQVLDAEGRVVGKSRELVTSSGKTVYFTNDKGIESVFFYSPENQGGKLLKQSRLDGSFMSYSYDELGRVVSKNDFNGNYYYYEYGSGKKVVYYPDGIVRTVTFDTGSGRIVRDSVPGRSIIYGYDDVGRLVEKKITAGGFSRVWLYSYDLAGRLTYFSEPVSGGAYLSYDQVGNLKEVRNALGQVHEILVVDDAGRVLKEKNFSGDVYEYEYDGAGKVRGLRLNGSLTSYSFSPEGWLSYMQKPDGQRLNYSYNSAGQVVRVSDGAGAVAYSPDAAGRAVSVVLENVAGIVSKQDSGFDPYSGKVSYVVDGLGNKTGYMYDRNGNVSRKTDALGRVTNFEFNSSDQNSSVAFPNGMTASTEYDSLGYVASVTTPDGQVTTYTRNGFGDVLTQVSPDTGTTKNTYYPNGLLKTRTDARGKTASYTYDALGRVTGIAYGGGLAVAYVWDSPRVGSLGSISVAGTTVGYGYDAYGKIATQTQAVGTVQHTQNYAWDSSGKLLSLTTPSGQVIRYQYGEGQGQPNGITVNNNPLIDQIVWVPFSRTPNGWRWSNGLNHVRALDNAGRNLWTYTDNLLSRRQKRDAVGNLLALTDTLDASRSQTFSYDTVDQLVAETGSKGRNYQYLYDGNGNRTDWWQDSAGNTGLSMSYAGNLLQSLYALDTGATRNVIHDAAGNRLSDGKRIYTYDARGRLSTIKMSGVTTTYQYNGLGQRISKNGRLFVYDREGHLLGEYTSSGALIQETVWLNDLPVATLRPNGMGVTVYHVHPDELGSPRVVSTPDQQVVWRWDSDAFGTTLPNEDPSQTGVKFSYHLRFPGQYYDVESGLHYNYFRDYDPQMGRYVQSDPIGLAGGVNTYGYVGGNPISIIDPYGLWGFVFNGGFHIPAVPLIGVSAGPSVSSTWTPGQGLSGASFDGGVGEVVLGSIADVGVSAGIGSLSSCTNGKPRSLNLGIGRYSGVQLNFKGDQFDGITVGLGLGVSLPVTVTVPAR